MHSHVAQETPDHHDQQLFATDTDGVLLRRRHPIKLAVVGLAMVTLLGAAGCGGPRSRAGTEARGAVRRTPSNNKKMLRTTSSTTGKKVMVGTTPPVTSRNA